MDRFPGIDDLERRARRRLPRFSWEYLASGTGDEGSLRRNRSALDDVMLRPQLLKGPLSPDTRVTVFGETWSAPIGVAPVGLTGLIWPNTDTALATMAAQRNIPHVLSTVGTTSLEDIGPLGNGRGWFQLYPPRDPAMRDDLLARAQAAGFRTLVVTADVPYPSRRERQRKARVRVPPVVGPYLLFESATHPAWAIETIRSGPPSFRVLEQYVAKATMQNMAGFVGASLGGTLSWEYLAELRHRWNGPIVVKGILDPGDAARCVEEGADAVQVSNHGGRQLEAAPSPVDALPAILDRVGTQVPVFFDSGVRSGADVARALACGATLVFAGRAFLFGMGALGAPGAEHAADILLDGLVNVMHQTGCAQISDLPQRLQPPTRDHR